LTYSFLSVILAPMKRNDIVIGLIILALLAGAIYFFRRPKQEVGDIPQVSIEDRLEESFNMEIPDDLEKAELIDVSGGTGSGIATRSFENGRFSHMILADLPDPTGGEFYQGWLVQGDTQVPTGKMRIAKGGYLLELNTTTDYSDYDQVMVTLEKIADSTPETTVLEGSF